MALNAPRDLETRAVLDLNVDQLLAAIQPNAASELRRLSIARHVIDFIRACFPEFHTEAFVFGSVPLKTYLPDGDIDISVFCPQDSEDLKEVWATRLLRALETEAATSTDPLFRVRDAQLIQAEVKLVKFSIADVIVDISFDTLSGLCTAAFLESVDRALGRNHLFKQSVLLIKAWCYYEARLLGAHHGLFSSYALETMVLYILLHHHHHQQQQQQHHQHHQNSPSPLDLLRTFLRTFADFPWEYFALSLQGPIPLHTLPDHPYIDTSLMPSESPLLDEAFLEEALLKYGVNTEAAYMAACTLHKTRQESHNNSNNNSSKGGGEKGEGEPSSLSIPMVLKYINIMDPLLPSNNLGRSVSRTSFARIRRAFAHGADQLEVILNQRDPNMARLALSNFFRNTWRSQFRMGSDNQQFLSGLAAMRPPMTPHSGLMYTPVMVPNPYQHATMTPIAAAPIPGMNPALYGATTTNNIINNNNSSGGRGHMGGGMVMVPPYPHPHNRQFYHNPYQQHHHQQQHQQQQLPLRHQRSHSLPGSAHMSPVTTNSTGPATPANGMMMGGFASEPITPARPEEVVFHTDNNNSNNTVNAGGDGGARYPGPHSHPHPPLPTAPNVGNDNNINSSGQPSQEAMLSFAATARQKLVAYQQQQQQRMQPPPPQYPPPPPPVPVPAAPPSPIPPPSFGDILQGDMSGMVENLALARGSKAALLPAAVTYTPTPQAAAEGNTSSSSLPKGTSAVAAVPPPSSSHPRSHPLSYHDAAPPPPPPSSIPPPTHPDSPHFPPPSPPLPSSPAAAVAAVEGPTRPGREQGGRYITSITPNKNKKRPQPQPQPVAAVGVTAQQSASSYSIVTGGGGGGGGASSSSAKSTPGTTPKAGAPPHQLDWKKQFVQGLVSRGQKEKGGYKDAAVVSTGSHGATMTTPTTAGQPSVVATAGKQMTKPVTAAAASMVVVEKSNEVEPGSPISHPLSANATVVVRGSSKPKSWSQAVVAGGVATTTTSVAIAPATAHVNNSSSSSGGVASRGGGDNTEKRKPVTTTAGSAAAGAKKPTTKPKGTTNTTTSSSSKKKKTSEGSGNDGNRVKAEASSHKQIQLTSVDEFPSL